MNLYVHQVQFLKLQDVQKVIKEDELVTFNVEEVIRALDDFMKAPTYSPFLPTKKEMETKSRKTNVEHNVEKSTGHIEVAQHEGSATKRDRRVPLRLIAEASDITNKKRGKGRKCPSTEEVDKENIPPKKKDKHVSVPSKRTTVRILPKSSNTMDNAIGVLQLANNTEIAVNPLKENQSARNL